MREQETKMREQETKMREQGAMERHLPVTKRLLDNFIAGYKKPFNAEIMAEMTGLSRSICEKYLRLAEELGEVKKIEKGIWLVKQNDIVVTIGNWKYSRRAAEAVLEVIRAGDGKSIRKIAMKLGFSRQYVYKYLEALASIGAVAWDGSRYISTGQGDMLKLGTKIEKGILSRIKREVQDE
jgi:response regulator of citrate/malate metabolism